MDFAALEQFLHLSRTLHFGRTAREVHVSPSALSRSMQRLEHELGAQLLRRDGRSVELTAAGVAMQRYASEALAGLHRLRDTIRSGEQSLSGSLRVFCSVTAAHSFMPRLLSQFRKAYPDVTIELETGYALSALEMLERGAVDVTVAALPDRIPRGLVTRVVTRTPLLFVAPRAECEVSRAVDARPIDWASVPMILPQAGIARAAIDRFLRERLPRGRAQVYGEVSGNEAALALVSLGCGVGIVPGLVLEKSPLRGEVRVLDVRPRLPEFRVGVCAKQRALEQPIVAAFFRSVDDSTSRDGVEHE